MMIAWCLVPEESTGRRDNGALKLGVVAGARDMCFASTGRDSKLNNQRGDNQVAGKT